ncbi:MAG: hypothetical protein SGARI_000933, partial [Bacillariaceae sp.]
KVAAAASKNVTSKNVTSKNVTSKASFDGKSLDKMPIGEFSRKLDDEAEKLDKKRPASKKRGEDLADDDDIDGTLDEYFPEGGSVPSTVKMAPANETGSETGSAANDSCSADDLFYQTPSGEWLFAKNILQGGRFATMLGVLGQKTGRSSVYRRRKKKLQMVGYKTDLAQFKLIYTAAYESAKISKGVYDTCQRIFTILRKAPHSAKKPRDLPKGRYQGHHGILNSLGGHDDYWLLEAVHYEIHLLYKDVFRNWQCVGGVVAFISHFPKGTDYRMALREKVANKPLALAIHDAFFFGQTEDLDEDELSGLGFAEYLSKHWKRGGAAGAAQFKEQLGDDGYFKTVDAYLAYFSSIGKLGHAGLKEKLGTEEAFKEHMSSLGKLGHAKLKENLGEEAYHENCVAGGKASIASTRQTLGEEEFRRIQREKVTKSQDELKLSVSHPPGASDATDYKVFNTLKGRFSYWKKEKGFESKELKALMEQYREGHNRHRRC